MTLPTPVEIQTRLKALLPVMAPGLTMLSGAEDRLAPSTLPAAIVDLPEGVPQTQVLTFGGVYSLRYRFSGVLLGAVVSNPEKDADRIAAMQLASPYVGSLISFFAGRPRLELDGSPLVSHATFIAPETLGITDYKSGKYAAIPLGWDVTLIGGG